MGDNGMIQKLGKVGVLMGGFSAERDVSRMSGSGVLQALQSCGMDAHAFDPAERSLAELANAQFDRVFIALHGRYGEDGTMQGTLEQLRIPYTGSGVMASALAMDKTTTKLIWEAIGLPTPKYRKLVASSDSAAVCQELGLPLIVKPAHEGSTIGLTKVTDVAQLPDAYALASRLDPDVLAEEFIDGRELTCAVLEIDGKPVALPLVEIVAPDANYDYQTKYFSDAVQYHCPADLPQALTAEIQDLVLKSYRALNCRGWARVDLMLRQSDGRPFLLELNTSPGMTGHSLVPMAAKAAGISYEELCLKIIQSARLDLNPTTNWKPE